MTILLLRPYATFAQGATVDLDNATEAALVAQGRATFTVNPGSAFAPLTAVEQQALRDGAVNLTASGASGVPKISVRSAGNLTTGIGADFNGTSLFGKLNLGTLDNSIPANTLVAGTSFIRLRFGVFRVSADTATVDIRIGGTNGTADNTIAINCTFSSSANNTVNYEAVIGVTATKYVCNGFRGAQNVGTIGEVVESASAPVLTQLNYVNIIVNSTTTGAYRVTDFAMDVFQ
jgi:hypothetical protein